jgi:RNA polymerase sigma factor (sigma-70 family)
MKYCPPHLTQEDLFQGAMLGLMENLDHFDPKKSDNFLLFAHVRMATSIIEMLYESGLIKIPRMSYWREKQKKEKVQFQQIYLEEFKTKFHFYGIPRAFHEIHNRLDIDSILSCLTSEEREFIMNYFGINKPEQKSLTQLGKDLYRAGNKYKPNRYSETAAANFEFAKRMLVAIFVKMKNFLAQDTNLALEG